MQADRRLVVREQEGSLWVELEGTPGRLVPAPDECQARARVVAVLVASWLSELSAPGLRLPTLPAPGWGIAFEGLGPAASLEQKQGHAQLYRALEQVKEKHRSVLIFFELEGLSGAEISALTGTPIATVWVRLHRGRSELEARFSELSKGEHR